jgi:DNA-binding NtrC family response regulator
MTASILLVDDHGPLLELLSRFFEKRDWTVCTAATGAAALERFGAERPDVVLLDLDLPDVSGLPVLERMRELDDEVGIIMLTGHGDIPVAVEAMRAGAENFLTKPFDMEHLAAVVDRAAEKVKLKRRNRFLARSAAGHASADRPLTGIPGPVAHQVERMARGDATILLLGETGTGKGWVARHTHDRSDRARAPFVEVNCAGLSGPLLESELFGHEQGAFTDARAAKQGLFEVADGGTLFLDEIGDLALDLQPKLLKVLETRRFRRVGGTRERTVDVRLIAATNQDLHRAVESGHFRQDLFYRLAVLPLELPPLREREPGDIVDLAYRLLGELGRTLGLGPIRIDDDALHRLATHQWPGNIRELRNVLERILILGDTDSEIRLHHLPAEIRGTATGHAPATDGLSLHEVERRHIVTVLERNGGNRSRTARELGIARATLYEKIERHGLQSVGR